MGQHHLKNIKVYGILILFMTWKMHMTQNSMGQSVISVGKNKRTT